MKQPSKARQRAILLGCAMLLVVSSSAHSAGIEAARNGLPESIKKSGTIHAATSLGWAPFDYADESGHPAGIDIDLINLLASKLGVKVEFADLGFPTVVPGVTSGRYDMAAIGMSITDERAKVVDFVPYFKSDWALLIKKGSPDLDINNLCGHTLSITQGSSQVPLVDDLTKQCTEQGHQTIKTLVYSKSSDTYMAVTSARAEGFIVPQATALYIGKMNTSFTVASKVLRSQIGTVVGFAIGKKLPGLRDALQAALSDAIKDGSYQKILIKYGVPDSAYSAQ
jgi:polar amino acid transport system substrate-binding protein